MKYTTLFSDMAYLLEQDTYLKEAESELRLALSSRTKDIIKEKLAAAIVDEKEGAESYAIFVRLIRQLVKDGKMREDSGDEFIEVLSRNQLQETKHEEELTELWDKYLTGSIEKKPKIKDAEELDNL